MLTSEQLAFIRKHGITRCPPGPCTRMFWGKSIGPGRRLSEEEMILLLARLPESTTLSEYFELNQMKRQAGKRK
jgi:hypothetical protein